MSRHYLTKSRYLQGLQCPKLLWLNVNEPGLAAETPPETQLLFDIGHKVGKIAHQLFKGGVLIEEDHRHLRESEIKTRAWAAKAVPAIFEATALYKDYACRADILQRLKGKTPRWDIYEVKSTASLKPELHIPDVAMQRFTFESAGYTIRKTYLMHIDTKYVRKGPLEPERLLVAKDITEDVTEYLKTFAAKSRKLIKVLMSTTCPRMDPGPQCAQPYTCPFYDKCNLPAEPYTVRELSGSDRGPAPKLEALGIKYLKDIPDDYPLNKRHRNQVLSVKQQKPVIDKQAVKALLAELVYPLYYFDFETFNPAVPLFDNSRPYENLPFQFSLDIQKKPGGKCAHFDFLLQEPEDPRIQLIEHMLHLLGTKGSIVAYNISFEKGIVGDLAVRFPQYAKKLNALLPRFWDLIVPFRSGVYAHYDFFGSASLKNVLPILVPKLSYENLEIQEGGTASLRYTLWMEGAMDQPEWNKTYKNLLKYCRLDTQAMVKIVKVLYASC